MAPSFNSKKSVVGCYRVTVARGISLIFSLALHALGFWLLHQRIMDERCEESFKKPTLEITAVELSLLDTPQETPAALPSAPIVPPAEPVAQQVEPEPVVEPATPAPVPEPPMPAPVVEVEPKAPLELPVIAPEPPQSEVMEQTNKVLAVSVAEQAATTESVEKNVAPAPELVVLSNTGGASGRIDAHPALERAIRPVYPLRSRRRGEEGTVILDVVVDAGGRVAKVNLVTSSGFSEIDRAAERATLQARFTPGMRAGKPIQASARLTIIFRLRDS